MAFSRTYKNEFMRYMSREGVKYQEKGSDTVRVGYRMDNLTLDLFVSFDSDGDRYVTISSYSIGSFPENAKGMALIACNMMNKKYRWVKFYLDDDNDIVAQSDAVVDIGSVGPALVELCKKVARVMDEAYPLFMKARWS